MDIIAVDDERHSLERTERVIRGIVPGSRLKTFASPKQALEYAKTIEVNVAFLDIDMPGMNGITLAKRLKGVCAKTEIIFATGYRKSGINPFDLRASGYLFKPINAEKVENELNSLHNPVPIPEKGISVQCFGDFEVFVDSQKVQFTQQKSKEAFAYLVHRQGIFVKRKELALALWPDADYDRSIKSRLRTVLSEMIKALTLSGAKAIVKNQRGGWAFVPTDVRCDYISFINADGSAIKTYKGEYMNGYSWAAFSPVQQAE